MLKGPEGIRTSGGDPKLQPVRLEAVGQEDRGQRAPVSRWGSQGVPLALDGRAQMLVALSLWLDPTFVERFPGTTPDTQVIFRCSDTLMRRAKVLVAPGVCRTMAEQGCPWASSCHLRKVP